MSHYFPLFSIAVGHEFFAGSACSCLDFVATPKTNEMISNAGLLLRSTHDGIHVAYDESRLEALQQYALDADEALYFEFKAYSTSPEFKDYSEPFPGRRGEVLYFSNDKPRLNDGSRLGLHEQDYVSEKDFVSVGSVQTKDVLNQKDRLIAPVFVVKISASAKQGDLFDQQLKPIARDYQIRFKTRETRWKYFLLGDIAQQGIYIVDSKAGIDFEPSETTVLADQRTAMTIRSKQSIPLSETYDFNFQLRQIVSGKEKVLIKRLPVARINQTGKEVVAEQGMVVSEIYINS